MGKSLFIAEKPSVAQEFAKALGYRMDRRDGYMESEEAVVTWCVGHLVTMSYPESYRPELKKWSVSTLPFLPKEYLYEVIPEVKKQFGIVKGLLNRKDVATIYVCTDSGREGEYIYRLVDQMAGVPATKEKKRVWIDSQTEEEILRGIREAKPISEYDNISASAYLRAKEDYLMGINFSRILSLKYGSELNRILNEKKYSAIAVGRVMTCVLGMVVRREREIRSFVKTPFYRVSAGFADDGKALFEGEWKAVEGSLYFNSPKLYKENGFREREDAKQLVMELSGGTGGNALPENQSSQETGYGMSVVEQVEKKQEKKQPPLLYNLAELQNQCSKFFKLRPEETLKIVQELYEKKLVTYPRTDARVLSTAVSKEIHRNLSGLRNFPLVSAYASEILEQNMHKNLARTKYVNDKQITDHYAIIPTGQGLRALSSLSPTAGKIYETIVRRFLAIFYPPAVYQKISVTMRVPYQDVAREGKSEAFFASFKVQKEEGWHKIMEYSFFSKKAKKADASGEETKEGTSEGAEEKTDPASFERVKNLKKGSRLSVTGYTIKEGETSPPKRYNSGSLILAMENAGQFIEDEDLRAQIKGSGIGTSATRAGILEKLINISYLSLNKKTQIVTPSLKGELIFDIVNSSIRSLLNPELTASWEKGLTYVAEGSVTEAEYMEKLEGFITRMIQGVKNLNNQGKLPYFYQQAVGYYDDTRGKKP